MENKRAIVIALICFLISMLLINAYAKVRRHELTSEFGEEVTVVVAAKDIPEYGMIRPDMLGTQAIFKKFRQPFPQARPKACKPLTSTLPISSLKARSPGKLGMKSPPTLNRLTNTLETLESESGKVTVTAGAKGSAAPPYSMNTKQRI